MCTYVGTCVCVEVCVLYARIFAFQLFSSNFIPKAHMFGDNVSALKPGRLSQVSQEALISSFCSHRINYCQGQPPRPHPSALAASLWTSVFARTQTCMQIVTCACPLSLCACACMRARKAIAFTQMPFRFVKQKRLLQ